MPIDFVEEAEEPKIDFMPEEPAAPAQQSMGEFLAGVPQGVMAEAEKWKQAASEGMAPIGKALNVAGQNWKDLLGAYAFKLIGERGLAGEQLAQAAVRYLRPNALQVPTPLEEGMRALPGPVRIPSEALYGTVETGPRLATMAAMTAAGIPAPAAAAGAFGATPEGFSPKEAAIAAALPVVGHYTGKIAEVIAKELGVSTDAALSLWNKVGGATGAAGLLEGVNEAEISKLPKEQQREARIQAFGGILAQSILGMMGGREQGKPPIVNRGLTGEALTGRPEGAVPPPEGTIFLEEQPRIIAGEEKVVQTPEQEIVEAQRLAQHGTPEEQALALERLKVLRTGQEREFTPVNPPIGAEKSTGALRTAEDLIAERKQPVFDDTLELGSGIPIQPNERELNRQFRDLPVGTKVILTGVKDDAPFNASVEVRLPNGNTANIPPEWLKSPTTAKRRTLPQLVKDLGRNEVERLVGEWDDTAHLSEDGKSIVGFVDPRNQTGKSKLSTREFLDFLESDAAKALTKTPGLQGETLQLGAGIPLQSFPEPLRKEIRDIRSRSRGGVVLPKVTVRDLSQDRYWGGYSPATGEVFLNEGFASNASPEQRASVVRHELAHKIETEMELWKNSDDYLWRLWQSDRNHPIWDFMGSITGRWQFDNAQSPEIIAELYANHYPKGTFTLKERPVPYEWEGDDLQLPKEYPIPKPLMSVLNKIEDRLGIWSKKLSRAKNKSTYTATATGSEMALGAGIPLERFPEPVLRELRDLRNARRGIAWRWQNRDPLETMAYTKGVAKNRAAIFAQQATHQVQNQLLRDVLGTTKPTLKQKAIKVGLPAVNPNARVEEALTFVREAGNDPAKLAADRNKIATAPDPALDPISLALWKGARDKALDRIDFALANLPKLVPASQAYARTTLAQALQERAVGMDTPLHRNYVMHAQDVEGDMDLGIFSAGGKSGESVRFKKARAFPDLASSIAAGYTPISMNAIDLLRARLNAGQRNINNRAWVDSLKTMTDVDGNPIAAPITVKHVPGPFPRDEQVVPKGYERVNFNGTDLAVLKGYSGLFRSLTEPSAFTRSPLGESIMAATHTGKHSLLLFDTFHLGRLSFWASIIQHKPTGYRKGLTLLDNTLPELHAMAARGEIPASYLKDVVRNKHLIDDVALKTGYNVAGISDNLYSSLTEHIPITGAFNKFLFKEFQSGAMTEAWLYEFDRVSKQNPGKSEQEVGRMVSKNLNTRFGTLNEQSIIKNKTFTDLARLTFLAPQWNEGLITSELVGSGQLAKVPFDLATKGRIVVGTLGRSIGTLALFHFAANQIINMVTRGYPTWKNPEEGLDAKLSAWVPDTTGSGSGYFISPIALPLETAHLLYKGLERSGTFADAARRYLTSRLSFLGRTAWTAGAKRDVFDRPIRADRYWKEVGKSLIPVPISGGAAWRLSKELAGRGIAQLEGTEYEGTRQQFPGQYQKQAMASMGIKSENAPNAIQRIARLAKDYNREQGVPENAEYSESDYNQLNQFLNVGNVVEAKDALNQLLKTKTLKAVAQHYRSAWKYPFTRNKERERGFFKSLSTEQQKAYTQAKEMKAKTSELAMRLLGKVQDEQARAQASPE